MRDVVTILDTAVGDWQVPGETITTTSDARIKYEEKMVQLSTGGTVQSLATIDFPSDTVISMTSRILLPGETTSLGNGHQIITIIQQADFRARGQKVRIA